METLSIHDAQSRLPELVEKAEGGETIVLTRDGAPVAEICARPRQVVAPGSPAGSDASFASLMGRIAARAEAQPGAGALRLLREMRDESR